MTTKITVFWDVIQCHLTEVYQHFTETYCLHLQSSSRLYAITSQQTIILNTQLFYSLSKSYDQSHFDTIL